MKKDIGNRRLIRPMLLITYINEMNCKLILCQQKMIQKFVGFDKRLSYSFR